MGFRIWFEKIYLVLWVQNSLGLNWVDRKGGGLRKVGLCFEEQGKQEQFGNREEER